MKMKSFVCFLKKSMFESVISAFEFTQSDVEIAFKFRLSSVVTNCQLLNSYSVSISWLRSILNWTIEIIVLLFLKF